MNANIDADAERKALEACGELTTVYDCLKDAKSAITRAHALLGGRHSHRLSSIAWDMIDGAQDLCDLQANEINDAVRDAQRRLEEGESR